MPVATEKIEEGVDDNEHKCEEQGGEATKWWEWWRWRFDEEKKKPTALLWTVICKLRNNDYFFNLSIYIKNTFKKLILKKDTQFGLGLPKLETGLGYTWVYKIVLGFQYGLNPILSDFFFFLGNINILNSNFMSRNKTRI